MKTGERNTIQGDSTKYQGDREYQRWQNLIEDECGVKCRIVVRSHEISIQADNYGDYILAKSVVKPRTSLEIVRG